MAVTATTQGNSITIQVSGRFDFSSHQEFRQIYENVTEEVNQYTVDMKDATYLDSSALGMLLLMRDYAGGDSAKIEIINCNDDVKKILTISNFGQLFDIR
ncbi:STAS domain-containing protein [Reinekea marinisedimentorum]|uniref:Anti-anti-sigma factor n=1 Tax=Reinekea marinisedimentorum TaxID=230495 RepID=A0A4R3I962_9GAMM|nr:STAS domain-containing protein [Reinekea marinisedimentorum]TCS42418.1 anti-anti-sigma factor [Reinekea marinisedimentorum]